MTIRSKLNLAIAATILVFLAAAAYAIGTVRRSAGHTQRYLRVRGQSQLTADIRTDIFRHFMLPGVSLAPDADAESAWPKFLLEDIEVQIRLAEEDSERQRWQELRATVAALGELDRQAGASAALEAGVHEADRQLRALRHYYDAAEHQLIATIARAVFHAESAILAASLLAVLGFLVDVLLVRDWLVKPVDVLKRSADTIGRGNLDHRVPLTGKSELVELARSLDAMAASLARHQTALLEARELSAVGELCRNVAHGLRNPLAAIRASAQLSARRGGNEAEAAETLGRIIEQVDHMDVRISRLLELSRPLKSQCDQVAFGELAADAVAEAQPLVDSRGQLVLVENLSGAQLWHLDRQQVALAIAELLTNAAHHSAPGARIVLRGKAADCGNGSDLLRIEVIDQGCGMVAQTCDQAFSLFFSGRPGGTGVGLNMVKRVAERHNGRVDLQSTPGAGTTAALEIPDGPQALGGSGLNHDGSGATGVGTIGFAQRVLLMCAILAGPAAPALAATVAVRAVRVNGVPVPGGPSQIVSAAPGDQLDIELHLEDWAPHHLRGYQLRLDPASLRGGAAGALSVLAGSCSIQALRPDFVFAGFSVDPAAGEAFAAMDTAASVCRWTAGLIDAASSVSGAGPKYLAEVTLQVSADAAGGFAVALDPAATFLRNDAAPAAPIEPLELQSLVVMLGGCAGAADCADLDSDGVRDDNCLWWSCAAGACASVEIGFGDVGGQFGACQPDGATDGNDRFHVLNCFSNQDTAGGAGYPCEASPPQAFNTDPGGQFGSCQPDGICDGNDAFHTLNAFQHTTTCACPEGPAPRSPDSPPLVVAGARLSLKPSRTALRSTETVDVDVCLDTPLADLRGYQLHLSAAGGESGRLELVDIALPAGGVFAANAASNLAGAGFKDATAAAFWSAFNRATGQMLAGLDTAGVHAPPGSRLATYTYRASADAAGTFVVSLLADDSDPRQRTYLFPTPARGKIALASPAPVKLVITRRSLRAGQ